LRIEFGMVDGGIEGASSDGRQHVTIESNRSDQNISRSRVSCVLHVVGAHSSPLTRQHLVVVSHTEVDRSSRRRWNDVSMLD